jgi:hypothetical protein
MSSYDVYRRYCIKGKGELRIRKKEEERKGNEGQIGKKSLFSYRHSRHTIDGILKKILESKRL